MNEWNRLSPEIRNSKCIYVFKKLLLKFIRTNAYDVYNIHDPIGLKFLTRLRLRLSHLRQNFLDTLNPLCSCSLETESVSHYLLRCPLYAQNRKIILDNLVHIVGSMSNLSDTKLINLLLYGDGQYDVDKNSSILKHTISFLKNSERFHMPLL